MERILKGGGYMRRLGRILIAFMSVILLFTGSEAYAVTSNNWMSGIDGNKPLGRLSIPGTHDSGARYEPVAGTAKCQNLSIEEQLNYGVRYLDIRCRSVKNSFAIHHGSVYQHLNFNDVIQTCINFLNSNPSETIIMSVKEEYESSNSSMSFEDIFLSYVNRNPERWYLGEYVPELKDVRGKIVLLRRFNSSRLPMGINASPWKDNAVFAIDNAANLRIQDCYNVKNINDKWNAIEYSYNYAKASNDNCLFINYTSGYMSKFLGIPNITSLSNNINPKINDYFSRNTKGRFGITAMDFADMNNCSSIIRTNF